MKRHLLICLSAVVILFSACTSEEIQIPTLYNEGLDSTFVQVNTTCDTVPRKFTRCDSTIGTYMALVPKTDTARMHLKLQGDRISADSLKALLGRLNHSSGTEMFTEKLWLIVAIVGGISILLFLLNSLKDLYASKRDRKIQEAVQKRERDELLDSLRKEIAAKESATAPSSRVGCAGGDCALKPLSHILTRKITIEETYAAPADKTA